MNCDVCGTELTEFNATTYRHVHDVGNCAQVLLAQRDKARDQLEEMADILRAAYPVLRETDRWSLVDRIDALKLF